MEANIDKRKAQLALEMLGDHPDEIARTLRTARIVGEIGEPDTCPIALYLTLCGARDPMVCPLGIGFGFSDNDEFTPERFPSLKNVFRFVDAFDQGAYPLLASNYYELEYFADDDEDYDWDDDDEDWGDDEW